MSGLDNLKTRLNYNGGAHQVDRIKQGKLDSLKKALLYSYQSSTIVLEDGREFRCLIEKNKMSNDLDNKIISIPFKDICLNKPKFGTTKNGEEIIGLKPGSTFTWKDNNTHWIVLLQYKTEVAYFRAQIQECKQEVEINNKKYWCYIRGPVEQSILWENLSGNFFNKLNYSLIMYITKNEDTESYFHRFSKIKIAGKPWEVQTVDNISMDGIIEVVLKETFQNTIEEKYSKKEIDIENIIDITKPYIEGEQIVRPYDIKEYKIHNAEGGVWNLNNSKKAIIESQDEAAATINILTGKSGNIILSYIYQDNIIDFPIEIKSL